MNVLLRCTLVVLMALAVIAPASPAKASGIPVVDVANLVENVRQAYQTYEQYLQDFEHYRQMVEQYRDFKENWKKMALDQLLLSAAQSRDPRLGYSALQAAQYLNADAGTWRDSIETLLRIHYDVRSPDDLQRLAIGNYSGNLDPAYRTWEREYREQAPLLDAYHFQAAQEHASHERMNTIGELQATLNGLGERSEVRQLQAIGSGVTVLARQNEASIDAMHMMMALQSHEAYRVISARARAREGAMQHAAAVRDARMPCRRDCLRFW